MALALNRHHRDRIKHNRRWHWGIDLSKNPKFIGRVVNTSTPCSCSICGNPRKWFNRKTLKELLHRKPYDDT